MNRKEGKELNIWDRRKKEQDRKITGSDVAMVGKERDTLRKTA